MQEERHYCVYMLASYSGTLCWRSYETPLNSLVSYPWPKSAKWIFSRNVGKPDLEIHAGRIHKTADFMLIQDIPGRRDYRAGTA